MLTAFSFRSQRFGIHSFHPLTIPSLLLYANVNVVSANVSSLLACFYYIISERNQNVIDYEMVYYAFTIHFAIVQLLRQINRFFIELHFLFFRFSSTHFLTYSIFTLWPISKRRCRHRVSHFRLQSMYWWKIRFSFSLGLKIGDFIGKKISIIRSSNRCYRDYCSHLCDSQHELLNHQLLSLSHFLCFSRFLRLWMYALHWTAHAHIKWMKCPNFIQNSLQFERIEVRKE